MDLYVVESSKKLMIDEIAKSVNLVKSKKIFEKYSFYDITHHTNLNLIGKSFKSCIRVIQKLNLENKFIQFFSINMFSNDYDFVISYTGMPGIWDKIAENVNVKEKRIVYIHNNPNVLGIKKKNIDKYYAKFHDIICVSKEIENILIALDNKIFNKTHVIYNYIDTKKIMQLSLKNESPYDSTLINIVTVSRLHNDSKRIDRIIEIVNLLITTNFIKFVWHIVGSGPDEKIIKSWIKQNDLSKYIILHGYQKNPYPYIMHADLFVMSSDYEGLPVTFMESLYLKTPVLTTNIPCAYEIIKNNKNGFIIEKEPELMAKMIISFFTDKSLYLEIKKNMMNHNYDFYLSGEKIESILGGRNE